MALILKERSKNKKWKKLGVLIIGLIIALISGIIFYKLYNLKKSVTIEETFDVTYGLEAIKSLNSKEVLKSEKFLKLKKFAPQIMPKNLGKENLFD